MDLAHTTLVSGRGRRPQVRFPIAPGYELRHRFADQAFGSALAIGLGITLWLQAQNHALVAVTGAGLVVFGVDTLLGWVRMRWAPTWRLEGDRLCLQDRCLPLDRLVRVGLEPYRPYLLRFDHLPVLRMVLEWPEARWAVPLTHENWERLWERLQQHRPGLVDWPRHPALLRGFAQGREVPYHLPPGVVVDNLGVPGWARALQLGLGGGVLLLGLIPIPFLQAAPSEFWFGLAGALALVVERRARRFRVTVSTHNSGKGA